MIVVDTNVLVYLWLPSEKTDISEKVHQCDSLWIAPVLWRSEFRNVVSRYMKRGAAFQSCLESVKRAESQMKGNELQVNSEEVLLLVKESGCTAYDCEFVHVAQAKSVPLITFDTQILLKFPLIAIDPLKFIARSS